MTRALPEALINSLEHCEGFRKEAFLEAHVQSITVTSIRRNPSKISESELINHFADAGITLEKVPWCETGFNLSERPLFTADPLFHSGCYYVQESSSMFLEQAFVQLLDKNRDIRVLDLCAAPGGKSTLVQSIISSNSLLVSNEVIRSRAGILEENMSKWGSSNVVVLQNDPVDFKRLPGFFDVLVVDAPCSGSGLFRRDPGAVEEWSEDNVNLCSQRQQRIISDVLPSLKTGGMLFYSTCSYSEDENEQISLWLQQEMGMIRKDLFIDSNWDLVTGRGEGKGIRFWPDRVSGEGFYLACFQQTEGENGSRVKAGKKSTLEKLSKNHTGLLQAWMSDKTGQLQAFHSGEHQFLFPPQLEDDLRLLMSQQFYIRLAGVRIGKWAGKDLIPDHALAISGFLSPEIVGFSLNKETALNYLRREELALETLVSQQIELSSSLSSIENKGVIVNQNWVLAVFKGHPLGWMKVLKNRVNNYYPKEWRILKRSFD